MTAETCPRTAEHCGACRPKPALAPPIRSARPARSVSNDSAYGHLVKPIHQMIRQAHLTDNPVYRLEWRVLGSQQRWLRNCLPGGRAQPFAYGSDEYLALDH